MAAGDAAKTFSELRTDFLEGLKDVTSSSAINTIANRYLNSALQDMHMERWWWAERRSTIRTRPVYTTGTVAIAVTTLTTRKAVTGTDSLWNTNNSYTEKNAIAGDKMTIAGTYIPYIISAVGSDTGITLDDTTPYVGTDAVTAGTYAIYQDEYALASDFDDVIDTRFFDEERRIELIGPQEFYRRYVRNIVRSTPKFASLIELGPSASAALRRRVILGPAPDKCYLIPYRYYTTNLAVSSAGVVAANLSADSDEPIVPLRFRKAVVYKAKELWYSDRKDDTRSGEAKAWYETIMLRARAAKSSTEDRPRLKSTASSYMRRARFPYTHLPPRFSSVKFDQMEE